jgi:hypothetical protein
MRVITRAILDIESLQWLETDSQEYEGAVAFCKGDKIAKKAEQQQLDFQTQLSKIFTQQYGDQKAQLDYLNGQLKPLVENPTGFTPAQLAAQRTSASDTDTATFQQAQDALNNQTSQASGGSKLVGVAGANVQAKAELLNAAAQKSASDQNAITTQDALLAQQNKWNAVNVLSGNAAQMNPLGYASATTGAGSSVAGLSQAYTQSNQSQILGALGGIAGGGGTALAGYFGANG